MSSIFEDCQIWIEKGKETWKSYFSKWETFAKYEEDIPESELMYELNEKQKLKNQIHKKKKQPSTQKRVKSVIFKKLQNKHKKIVKKKKTFKKTIPDKKDKDVMGETTNEKNLLEISQNNEFEKILKAFFSDFLKSNNVFSVLFQTFSAEEIQMKSSENLFPEQKMPLYDFQFNMQNFSMAKQQFFSQPSPVVNSGLRSICPPRDAYIQGLGTGIKAVDYKSKGESPLGHLRNLTIETNVNSWNKKRHFSFFGNMTPPSGQKQNLEIKSCPPSFSSTRFENCDLRFERRLCEKINNSFKYRTISKMSITHGGKGPGTFCLHKRTNSVSLRMENSNFITPERKSSEQKCFNKIVSQKRHPSKKLFFDNNEENESDSDDGTEYFPLVTRRQNKRQKVDESETKLVDSDSDSDDCDAIFDRISKA